MSDVCHKLIEGRATVVCRRPDHPEVYVVDDGGSPRFVAADTRHGYDPGESVVISNRNRSDGEPVMYPLARQSRDVLIPRETLCHLAAGGRVAEIDRVIPADAELIDMEMIGGYDGTFADRVALRFWHPSFPIRDEGTADQTTLTPGGAAAPDMTPPASCWRDRPSQL